MQRNLRLIVCGGRQYSDRAMIRGVLDKLHHDHGITEVICGGSPGSDNYASQWAQEHFVAVKKILAEWQKHGHGAGPIRNQKMLDLKPDAVVAFPGGAGTADMCRIAREAGLKIWEPAVDPAFAEVAARAKDR